MKKTKKGKELASELMDDLLFDEQRSQSQPPKPPQKPDSDDSTRVASSAPAVDPVTTDTQESIYLGDSDDATIDIGDNKTERVNTDSEVERPAITHFNAEQSTFIQSKDSAKKEDVSARATVGRFASAPMQSSVLGGTEASLTQSENLRIAQRKILELEKEMERLRRENEQLAAAGETFRRKSDEVTGQLEKVQRRLNEAQESFAEEKDLLLDSLSKKESEMEELRNKVDEFESRLQTNIQKIRVRERELENRLELVRMESAALIRSKDELILDLKRQHDQLQTELENYRTKGQDLNRQLGDKQEILRRTVKALRLALSMLEGEEESVVKPLKKAK